jgi:hypothetical protein
MNFPRLKYLPVAILIAVVLLVSAWAACSHATTYPVWNITQRLQISGNVGAISLNPPGDLGWQGPDAGAAVTLSLHPRFSVFGSYDHGFAFPKYGDGGVDIGKVCAQLLVYPGINDVPKKLRMSVGTGPMWYGANWADSWAGWDVHLNGSYDLFPRVVLFGSYGHGFSRTVSTPDVDEVKIALNCLGWRK